MTRSGRDTATLWTAGAGPAYAPLHGDRTVDVAIVGGGIVGLVAASLLQHDGRRVAVLESRQVGRQTTGGSSAKITAQHSLIYADLVDRFGERTARVYADANSWAVGWLAERIASLGADCGYQPRPAYTYTAREERLGDLEREHRVAVRLGLPSRLVGGVPLPLPAAGALVFDGQAQFDPYAYALAEAKRSVGDGGHVYEGTRVKDVQTGASLLQVVTEAGTVTARDVIIATNLPILDRGSFYARAFPIAHLAIAAPVEGEAPDGMFISVDEPTHSLRWHRDARGRLWLIALGPRRRPGADDTAEGFQALEAFVREYFTIGDVEYRWWNEDFQSVDRLPYVGLLDGTNRHLFVATGFGGWGITNGVVAATILADAVRGRDNAWASVYDSTRRMTARAIPDFVRGNLPSGKAWILDRFASRPALDLSALRPLDGQVVEVEGKAVAVSRDRGGTVHAVSAACTHRGCVLGWNRAMQTWDCSCHGSSFNADGHVLRGPAVHDLDPRPDLLPAPSGPDAEQPDTESPRWTPSA